MSLNNVISTSLSGLFTNQEAIRVTANNISNVNTENYARVRVNTEAAVVQGTSAGVNVASIERVVDKFLETALRTSISNTEEFSAQREFHDRFQGVLGDPASDSSLAARLDQFYSSIADLTLNPADVLRRQQTISEMQSFLDQVKEVQIQIQNLRSEASQQVTETVQSINEELQRIDSLNPLIVRQQALGGETGGLEGQLARSLAKLSEQIDIRVSRAESGQVTVTTQSGYPLVDSSLSQLTYNAPGIVSSGTFFPAVTINRVDSDTLSPTSSSVDITPHFRSGRLAGLTEMRDRQLVDLSLAIGEMSAQLADEFNANQNGFVSVPPPNSMTGEPTFVDGGHTTGFTGMVSFAVVDDQNRLVSNTTVDFDGAAPADFDALITQVNTALGGNGTLSLTDGVMSFTATTATDGVVIFDDATTPSDRAGRGFSHFFGMNNLITANKPGIYETGLAGTEEHLLTPGGTMSFQITNSSGSEIDTVSVNVTGTSFDDMVTELNNVSGLGAYFTFALNGNGELTYTENAGFNDISLKVQSDTTESGNTGLSFTRIFGIGDTFTVDAAKELNVRADIQNDPNLLALGSFDATVAIGAVALTSGDQRGALALQNLETKLVSFSSAGELKAGNVTLSQYVARILGNAGLMAQRAENFEEDNQALQQEVFQRNADVSGVNMDEELANLVIFQNAYNAAARILSSVQELYDSLLNAI